MGDTFIYDSDAYDIVMGDGTVIHCGNPGFAVMDWQTGECFPSLLVWFAVIAGYEYAKDHGGVFGGSWFNYVCLGSEV